MPSIIPVTQTVTGNFEERMKQRVEKWKGTRVAVRLRVPPELGWWYWQEFGTATRGDPGKASGEPYDIYPVNAKALQFPGKDGLPFITGAVHDHPGIHPKRLVERVRGDIRAGFSKHVTQAFQNGAADDPTHLREGLVAGMTEAKDLIIGSIEEQLPGTRIDGRLKGATAGSVFAAGAVVEDVS